MTLYPLVRTAHTLGADPVYLTLAVALVTIAAAVTAVCVFLSEASDTADRILKEEDR